MTANELETELKEILPECVAYEIRFKNDSFYIELRFNNLVYGPKSYGFPTSQEDCYYPANGGTWKRDVIKFIQTCQKLGYLPTD